MIQAVGSPVRRDNSSTHGTEIQSAMPVQTTAKSVESTNFIATDR
jgi:hypothetical protein